MCRVILLSDDGYALVRKCSKKISPVLLHHQSSTRVPPESFIQDWMDRGFHDVYAEFSTCDLNVPAKTETTCELWP